MKSGNDRLLVPVLGLMLTLGAMALVDLNLPNVAEAQARRSRGHGRSRSGVTPQYIRQRNAWHRAAPRSEVRQWQAMEPPPLVLRPIGSGERFVAVPDENGQFDEGACGRAREALAHRRNGATHDVHPRTLEIVYRAVRRFNAPYVWVVSGFRETRSTSRHNQGRAMDIVLPGVSNNQLAAFLRRQGFVGVGVYPVSGFVHIDVRARSTYWVDYSGPGQRQRPRYVMQSLAVRNDRQARARGETQTPDQHPSNGSEPEEEVPERAEVPGSAGRETVQEAVVDGDPS